MKWAANNWSSIVSFIARDNFIFGCVLSFFASAVSYIRLMLAIKTITPNIVREFIFDRNAFLSAIYKIHKFTHWDGQILCSSGVRITSLFHRNLRFTTKTQNKHIYIYRNLGLFAKIRWRNSAAGWVLRRTLSCFIICSILFWCNGNFALWTLLTFRP